MPRGNKQEMKLLYLAKIFMEETGDAHSLTTPQIIDKLRAVGRSRKKKPL